MKKVLSIVFLLFISIVFSGCCHCFFCAPHPVVLEHPRVIKPGIHPH